MKIDKNILKGDKFADAKVISEKEFYAVVDVKVKKLVDGQETTVTKSVVLSSFGSRIVAKQELYSEAKKLGGKVTYFGAFKN